MNKNESEHKRRIRTFGRTGGRGLSARQQHLIDTLLPQLSVPVVDGQTLDLATLFPTNKHIWLEIGFGGGEHFVEQARLNPEIAHIGCEPFVEGMAKALTAIEQAQIENVRLWHDDARILLQALPDQCLSRVFIMFPDPWPKKKQQKRRLIQTEFLDLLHRVCKPGAKVRFATDVVSYADEALTRFLAHGGFAWEAMSADDWRIPPEDHVTTRYETKQLGDCAPVWFDFITQ